MILNILSGEGELGYKILMILVAMISLLPALTFHEWAHGYAAYKLGDSTAKADGRLSLNPLDHIDPIGSLMLLLVGFGWAKPVPVVTRNFKKPRRDFAIVSFAGPLANFVAGFVSAFLYVLSRLICMKFGLYSLTAMAIVAIFEFSMVYNIGLGAFNLIPLPPLDGSNILMCMLPPRIAAKYSQIRYYTQYIFIGLILLRYLPYPLDMIPDILFVPLNLVRQLASNGFIWLFETILSPLFF